MDEFLQMAAEQLGLDQASIGNVVGIVLGFLKDNAPGEEMQSLFDNLPGAQELIDGIQSGDSGGLLGEAAGALGGLLGDKGEALEALAQLKETGLQSGQIGDVLALFKTFASEKVGPDLIEKIMSNLPDLG